MKKITTKITTKNIKKFRKTRNTVSNLLIKKRNVQISRSKYLDTFVRRHTYEKGDKNISEMLKVVGVKSQEELMKKTVPDSIFYKEDSDIAKKFQRDGDLKGESEVLDELKKISELNVEKKSLIGLGYYNTLIPNVILRNVVEDPGWYTPYTPYQAEVAQGRLESLFNYQTMVGDLTGLPFSNASLLDEGTACAEAINLCYYENRGKKKTVLVSKDVFPQSLDVVKTRTKILGIKLAFFDESDEKSFKSLLEKNKKDVFALLLQYPNKNGLVRDYSSMVDLVKKETKNKARVVVGSDLLALTKLNPPGNWGADIAYGCNQRFGVPLGYGGPNAGFLSCVDKLKRKIPGRIIGTSKDSNGNPCYRMALQAREQHIRREKATSNICTAQALLANLSAFYAVYHGPEGLKKIATRVHELAVTFKNAVTSLGYEIDNPNNDLFFDTMVVKLGSKKELDNVVKLSTSLGYNFRLLENEEDGNYNVGLSMDESVTDGDLVNLVSVFYSNKNSSSNTDDAKKAAKKLISSSNNANAIESSKKFNRNNYDSFSNILNYEVFKSYHQEHEMLRYITKLRNRDISLANSMIPLGSCTMKLNATTEMIPITWPKFTNIHPFVPLDQSLGYQKVLNDLDDWLCTITGFDKISLQGNAGSQGEYSGLRVIKNYLNKNAPNGKNRNIVLIPTSAHGTNPATVTMTGMKVKLVNCDDKGNVDLADLKKKAELYKDTLAALMITYPSTHGVFEEDIIDICDIIHKNNGQVYMDGANMNAQVGLTSPGFVGADVCHLNLHKTFCIPHGGGGPGAGPIGVKKHLVPYLSNHSLVDMKKAEIKENTFEDSIGSVSSAPWGSPLILLITWTYIRLMGFNGLKQATEVAILNANYMMKKIGEHYPIVYTGKNGYSAHEFIVDIRPFKKTAGIESEDVAKRLMDFGFHAPTMSFPIANTLMIEPTESESKEELDRYINALITIRKEIKAIEDGKVDKENNALKNAPHTVGVLTSDNWDRPYSRSQAAYPLEYLKDCKIFPHVGRIDNAYGDRNLICSCPPIESYEE